MATMDEFWGTRDFCLIPVMNPKRETAPAALIFFSTIEKTTSYDAFGGADLAFSALVGWLLLPPNFHAGAVNVPEVDEMPSNCQRLLRQLRDTRAGKHVVHCYQKYRVPVYGVGELRPED